MNATVKASRFLRFAETAYPRRVILGDKFREKDVELIERQLRTFDVESQIPIVIEIDSNGGLSLDALRLVEIIRSLRSETYGLVTGGCLSSAFLVLQACTVRLSLPTGKLAVHNNFKGFSIVITADTQEAELEAFSSMLRGEIKIRSKIRDEIVASLQKKLTHYTRGELIEIMQRKRMMSPEEALIRKFLDEIIRP